MNLLKTVGEVIVANEDEQKVLIHEMKYALLGAILLVLFLIPYTSKGIASVFPVAKGPIIVFYKFILFIAIFYIIQKTDWFQQL